MEFSIRIIDLHWINSNEDDVTDLCLHGNVEVKIGNEIIDNGLDNGDWTLSAGAFRMLKSLYNDHESGKGEHLLPCCGHFMFVDETADKLIISGCPNGLDWSVIHENEMVKLITDTGTMALISYDEYKNIVLSFANSIKSFYSQCSVKTFSSDFDEQGYHKFWEEWTVLCCENPVL